jgi:hypothetical protein
VCALENCQWCGEPAIGEWWRITAWPGGEGKRTLASGPRPILFPTGQSRFLPWLTVSFVSNQLHARCVLLYKQLIRFMMDYACPIWRSAARIHVRKLQMLQSKCLHIATNAPWYVSNRQIHEDLGIPFFADHIRAVTKSFD